MRCLLCLQVAATPMRREDFTVEFLRTLAGLALDGLERTRVVCAADQGDEESTPPAADEGTLMTERCARLAEARCGACGGEACPFCSIASEIRAKSDALYAERNQELDELAQRSGEVRSARSVDDTIEACIEGLCDDHQQFGTILREEHCRRQTWALAAARG